MSEIGLQTDPSAEVVRAGSNFHKIRLASLRWKQLNRGAVPRVEADIKRRKNTSIAIEEVRLGLIEFSDIEEP